VGSKNYFNPRIKRISPAWVAEKNKFNEAKQKPNPKGSNEIKYGKSSGDRQQS
jgi:hypothetical protein